MVNEPLTGLDVSALVGTKGGVNLLNEALSDYGPAPFFERGGHRLRCPLPPILTPGEYVVGIWLGTAYDTMQYDESVLTFSVDGDDAGRPSRLLKLGDQWQTDRLADG